MVGVAIVGSAAISAGASAYGASSAASAQGKAGRLAMIQQEMAYQRAAQTLSPWIERGNAMGDLLRSMTPDLIAKFNPTMEQLEQTPGYQFALDQGLKGVQNSYAAKGLGSSGAALKGAASFAQGLASTTYQQQFQNYLAQNQQIYNMLAGQAGQGLQAGGALSGQSIQTGQGMAQTQAGIGNAQAAAYTAGATGVANAGNNALNQYLQWNQMQNSLGGQATGGGGSWGAPAPAAWGSGGTWGGGISSGTGGLY